jgi:hypothetical protein
MYSPPASRYYQFDDTSTGTGTGVMVWYGTCCYGIMVQYCWYDTIPFQVGSYYYSTNYYYYYYYYTNR